ncbi:MAG: hypothetical protein LBR20_07585 [Propionibacteriaceae bacterium]|jgi:2-keto-3-deoxy-6-phosphogluconate aldolase|nr:hypothetical protein [Propionibacteriaceae bacterium]
MQISFGRYRTIFSLPAAPVADLCAAAEALAQDGHTVWALPDAALDALPTLQAYFAARATIFPAAEIPTGLTPTELRSLAREADCVAVYPAQLFGEEYAPIAVNLLPQTDLIAAGDLDYDLARAWLAAGAAAVWLTDAITAPLIADDLAEFRELSQSWQLAD